MNVEKGEDPGIYWVGSASEEYPHMVDLQENKPVGACTCKSFYYAGAKFPCKHIKEAKKYERELGKRQES